MRVLLVSQFFCGALAYQGYKDKVPNGWKLGAVGHFSTSGGGTRNAFGNAFTTAGRNWTTALCELDSDGDCVYNGQEMGDPCSRFLPSLNLRSIFEIFNFQLQFRNGVFECAFVFHTCSIIFHNFILF